MSAGLGVSCVLRPLCSGLAHLFHVTSASGYILWWSVDYVSISLAILATSIVSGQLGLGRATAHRALTLALTLAPTLALPLSRPLRLLLPRAAADPLLHLDRRAALLLDGRSLGLGLGLG